jgi:RHS repeat-associated protein
MNDGKSTTSYHYDGDDARGRPERRGMLTSVDTTIGTFRASYTSDGLLDLRTYPNSLWALSVYDTNGHPTQLSYGMGATTSPSWLQWNETTNIYSQATQTQSPLSTNRYLYDQSGRLTQVEDLYDQVNCETRTYSFNADSNRTGLAAFPPSADGSCSTTTAPDTESHTYDAASRIIDAGYAYDSLGRALTIPASAPSGSAGITATYHVNDRVAGLTQGGRTQTFDLDPQLRIQTITMDDGSRTTNHYAGSGDAPAWITEPDGTWTRNITSFNGIAAIEASSGSVKLQLTNPHGDVVATMDNNASSTGVDAYFEYTEYGNPRTFNPVTPARYAWLGGNARSAEALGGIVLMGVRLYNPASGRMLQPDPVPGGCSNTYDYANQDPVNSFYLDGNKCAKGKPCKYGADAFMSCTSAAGMPYAVAEKAMIICGITCMAGGALGFFNPVTVGCAICLAAFGAWAAVTFTCFMTMFLGYPALTLATDGKSSQMDLAPRGKVYGLGGAIGISSTYSGNIPTVGGSVFHSGGSGSGGHGGVYLG